MYLHNSIVLDELVQKLTESYRRRWARHVANKDLDDLTIKDFATWIHQEAICIERICVPITSKKKAVSNEKNSNGFVLATSEKKSDKAVPGQLPTTCILCDKAGHNINKCFAFRNLEPSQRWDAVKEKKLCFRCLKLGHIGKKCLSKAICEEEGCGKWHHTLLHNPEKQIVPPSTSTPQS